MAIQQSIPKKAVTGDPGGFAALRKKGIETVQEMSGDVWTDYNLHDPGVTILEQLCYALTDLIDRSDYPVEDHLADDDGIIRFREQALHVPEDILPCRPSTISDYRKSVLSGNADIDNVWLEAAKQLAAPPACAGVYTATVKLAGEILNAGDERILAQIRKDFVSQRNLCEDIHESISVTQSVDCHLNGTIEVDGTADSTEVLAMVYQCAAQHIATSVHVVPLQSHIGKVTLPDLLTGPLTQHGHVHLDDTGERGDIVLIADLISAIQQIDSIVRVQNLSIRVMYPDGPKLHHESVKRRIGNTTLRLQLPRLRDSKNQDRVRLVKRGRVLPVSIAATVSKYRQLQFTSRAARTTQSRPANFYTLPSGQRRRFGRYFSLQNHFPDIYGINANGVPGSASRQTQASAKQLKAYLMLFEQILANHAANIDGVCDLFSNVDELGATYQYQVLDKDTIAGVDELYRSPPEPYLRQTLAEFDSRAERRSRQLDHMLAVFGERFTQDSLRHFNYYSSQNNQILDIALNKVAYLRHVVEITRDRIGGSDYTKRHAIAGFARRVSLLLGFSRFSGSLNAAVAIYHIDLDGAEQTRPSRQTATENAGDEFRGVPFVRLDPESDTQAWHAARQILRQSKYGRNLLVNGTRLELYRYYQRKPSTEIVLVLCSSEDRSVYPLARFADVQMAAEAANALQHYLTRICRASEGLHIVEHVLLRPAGAKPAHVGQRPLVDNETLWRDFYPLRFSVFFPNWTTRCQDKNFQLLAEETIRINSPAHVYGQCFWLSYAQMAEFEELQSSWENARQSGASPEERDNGAVRLIDYINSMQKDQCGIS